MATVGGALALPQKAQSYTPERVFEASSFVDSKALCLHAKQIIQASDSHQEIIYTGLSEGALALLDKLDELLESVKIRKNYNAVTKTLWLRIMPTEIHDCHQDWFSLCKSNWLVAGLLTQYENRLLRTRVGTTIDFIGGPYAGSRKEPDFFLRANSERNPTVVAESGWSESLRRLRDDMNLWFVGGKGETSIVIILKWETVTGTVKVKGDLEVYALDRNGMPVLRNTEVIFPAPAPAQAQNQRVRELFGQKMLPGRNTNDQFHMPLDLLRDFAKEALGLMGLVPA